MAMTAADVSIATNGNIRWEAGGVGSGPYTVLELHRFLQDKADDQQASGDDIMDITKPTPSERSTDQIITLNSPYNIDALMAEHLYDGSITQSGGAEVYSGLEVVGRVNLSTTTLMVIQSNSLYADGVHTPSSPFWGDQSTGGFNGGGNTLMKCLIKTRTGGADIDGKKVRIQAREYLDTYAEFEVTLGLANSTAAIFTSDDINNNTEANVVSGWTSIDNVEGYQTIDLGNGNGLRPYYSQWNIGTQTINDTYERAKWLQRRGSTVNDMHGIDGELFRGVTHQFNYDGASGNFTENEILSWGVTTTAGTAVLLADLDNGVDGTMWIQLLTGVIPVDPTTITGGTSGFICEINGSVTARNLGACFIGASTGTNIIGAFGIGFESTDINSSDKLTDLLNVLQTPPNNVTFTVSGIVAGEDYVLVGTKAVGNDFKFDQMTLVDALSGATETSVTVQAASIPNDTPETGFLRITLNTGIIRRVAYTSHVGDVFTIGSTDFSGVNTAAQGNGVMVAYIDILATATSETFTVVYDSPRSLFVRVRDGGVSPIKTFESPASLGSGGGSSTAIRTSDA